MQIKLFSCHNNALDKAKRRAESKFRTPKSMQRKERQNKHRGAMAHILNTFICAFRNANSGKRPSEQPGKKCQRKDPLRSQRRGEKDTAEGLFPQQQLSSK